jgi:hypothetical protein
MQFYAVVILSLPPLSVAVPEIAIILSLAQQLKKEVMII